MIKKNNDFSIKVIGVGGGGINALNRMIESELTGVEYIAADFDPSALERSKAPVKLKLGPLYTGSTLHEFGDLISIRKNGFALAEEKELRQAIGSPDVAIIVAGLGEVTASKATTIIAELAKETGALTLALITQERPAAAKAGFTDLRNIVDTVITIPDESTLKMAQEKERSATEAFHLSDNALLRVVQCLLGILSMSCFPFLGPPLPNVWGLEHLEVIARAKNGKSLLGRVGISFAGSRDLVNEAARMAITSPLLEEPNKTPNGVLVQFACDPKLPVTLADIREAFDIIDKASKPTIDILCDFVSDNKLKDELYITAICLYE